jgi:hypothetical protein
MKKYLLFIYSNYYPDGGLNDFEKDFDTIPEAEQYCRDIYSEKYFTGKTFQIVDYEDMKIVKNALVENLFSKEFVGTFKKKFRLV